MSAEKPTTPAPTAAPLTTLRVPEFGLNDTPEALRGRIAETLERAGFTSMARRFAEASRNASWRQVIEAAAPFVRVVYGPRPVPSELILPLAALLPAQQAAIEQGGSPVSLRLEAGGAELCLLMPSGGVKTVREKGAVLAHLGRAPAEHKVQGELVEVAAGAFGWEKYRWNPLVADGRFAGGTLFCYQRRT